MPKGRKPAKGETEDEVAEPVVETGLAGATEAVFARGAASDNADEAGITPPAADDDEDGSDDIDDSQTAGDAVVETGDGISSGDDISDVELSDQEIVQNNPPDDGDDADEGYTWVVGKDGNLVRSDPDDPDGILLLHVTRDRGDGTGSHTFLLDEETGILYEEDGTAVPAGTVFFDGEVGSDVEVPAPLVNPYEEDPVVVDQTTAAEEAGRLRLADDAPDRVADDEDATIGEGTGSGLAVDREFAGTNFEPSEEQLAGRIGQTSGDADNDPLTSFLGAAEAKLGGNGARVTPDDQTNASPAHGKPSVAEQESDGEPEDDTRDGDDGDDAGFDFVEYPDTGKPPEGDSGLDSGDDPDDEPDDSVEDPGPDGGEGALIPSELQAQLGSELGRFRAARPGTGDGTADPSEIESEAVGPAGALTSHAQQGQERFGQPDTEVQTGGGSNFNSGADSHGAGVITSGDDQEVASGRQRNDDPFDGAGNPPKPPAGVDDTGVDDGAESFLPPSENAGPVDAPADEVPDSIIEPA